MAENNPQEQQVQIKVTDEVLKGAYANMVQVAHTQEEFILDFMNLFPPSGILNARVVVSPQHMKRIVAALVDNLKKYEAQFGELKSQAPTQQSSVTSSTGHRVGFDTEAAQ